MDGISTRISMVDDVSAILQTIANNLNSVHSAFENAALQSMNASVATQTYQQLSGIVTETEQNIRDNINAQQNFNDEITNGERAAGGLKKILAGVVGVFSVKAGISWMRQSVAIANENIRLETQLASVMAARGATYEQVIALQERAAQIQQNSAISDTAMMGAGNPFTATAQDMANYAQYFTPAMEGNYRMLERRAGVHLTEMQREIIRNGDDMQRALMIQDIVNESWYRAGEIMAQTPEGMRASMNNALNNVRSNVATQLMPVFMVFFATIQDNMPLIEQAIMSIVPVLQMIMALGLGLLTGIVNIGNFADTHLGGIENLLWGIAAALAAVTAAKIAASAKAAILGLAFTKTSAGVWALNAALLKKNVLLAGIPMAIGAIVTGIMLLVDTIGGWEIAWLHTVNAVKTKWDWLQIGFFTGVYFIMDMWDRMILRLGHGGIAIVNFMGDMKANVLIMVLQSMVNGAIGLINRFIDKLNSLPMVEIAGRIDYVTFGTTVALENEAARQARLDDPYSYFAQLEANIAERAASLAQMQYNAMAATAGRLAEIDAIRTANYEAEIEQEATFPWGEGLRFDGDGLRSIERDVAKIAGISGENLKYWRDIAERDAINRFTTAKVNVRVAGIHNNINNNTDLNGVVDYIVDGVEEGIEITAERAAFV